MKIPLLIKPRLPTALRKKIRDKAISRTQTRLLIAGRKEEDFSEDELEIIVREEEDKIRSSLREKGLMTLAAALGLGWWL